MTRSFTICPYQSGLYLKSEVCHRLLPLNARTAQDDSTDPFCMASGDWSVASTGWHVPLLKGGSNLFFCLRYRNDNVSWGNKKIEVISTNWEFDWFSLWKYSNSTRKNYSDLSKYLQGPLKISNKIWRSHSCFWFHHFVELLFEPYFVWESSKGVVFGSAVWFFIFNLACWVIGSDECRFEIQQAEFGFGWDGWQSGNMRSRVSIYIH